VSLGSTATTSGSSSPTKFSITVNAEPGFAGAVLVEGNAPGSYPSTIDVPVGKHLQIEAVPAAGYCFVEWSGHLDGNDNPTSVRSVRNINIAAHFAPCVSKFTSDDEALSVTVPDGTNALDGDGNPLTNIEFVAKEIMPGLLDGCQNIGFPYQLGPGGATFDQPVTLSWNYDLADIPDGVDEEDMVLACYDEDGSRWVELPSDVDSGNQVITALLYHFSTFAITASPRQPTPATFAIKSLGISPTEANSGDPVTIEVLIANNGEEKGSYEITLKLNGVVEEEKEIALVGEASEVVAFITSQDESDTYSVDVNGLTGSFRVEAAPTSYPPANTLPPDEPRPWLIWIIAAAIASAVAIPLVLRRRRATGGKTNC